MQTIFIKVSGKVQGVFFRQSTKKLAEQLLLTGTVRNLENGDVEIYATGTKEHLEALLSWSTKGPPGARVHHVIHEFKELINFEGFRVLRG